jgi:ATP-dependent Clp protease adaptor protein ClpS
VEAVRRPQGAPALESRGVTALEREKQSGPTDESGTDKGLGWKVVLWNCSCHTFDQVESLLIKAIHCGLAKARAIAMTIHTQGKSVIFSGHKERCELVASILQDGGLKVTLEK